MYSMTDKEKVHELTNGEFEAFIKEGVVLVDFYADWCMPCLMMAPVLEELAGKLKGKIRIGKVNVEDNQTLAQRFSVSSIPNFVLLKDGEVIERFIGALSLDDFEEKLKTHL